MKQSNRAGMSMVELLISLAVVASLVGVATPMIQSEIRAARSARTAAQMNEVQKLLLRAANRNGEMAPFIPDTPYSIPKLQRPEFAREIPALVPKYLSEVPKDAWQEEIYRYGNYIMSNGDNGMPGDEDDVYIKITEFPEDRDPATNTVFTDRLEVEAMYQLGFIVLQIQRHIEGGGEEPENLLQLYDDTARGSPLDPWGLPYRMVENGGVKFVASAGPDQQPATEDDLTLPWDNPNQYEDSFLLGFRGWMKIYPTGETPTSTPIRWIDEGGSGSHVLFDASQATGIHSSAWVKPPPPGTNVSPLARVTCKFEAARTTGTVTFGLLLNYAGNGTGLRGTMILQPIDGNATLYLDNNAPNPGRTWYGNPAPKAFAGAEVSSDSWTFDMTLEVIPGSPPQARLSSTGSHAGSLTIPLPSVPKTQGAAGFFVIGPPPLSKYQVKVDNFGVYRN